MGSRARAFHPNLEVLDLGLAVKQPPARCRVSGGLGPVFALSS